MWLFTHNVFKPEFITVSNYYGYLHVKSSNQSSLQQVIIMAIYICNVFKPEFITASNYYGYLYM